MESQLQELLDQVNVDFHWDDSAMRWWVTGQRSDGQSWSSPKFQAGSLEQAREMAMDHILEYNHMDDDWGDVTPGVPPER